ncbi:hypothetical protein [Leptolyngbya sp. NIES-2104]|uniref:hypothetical protein n=1 Tax=Leptolyngbya sp. NIES-2104 TaxID=1552121 RepID=UPI0006EC7A24|nr:hypothetical protein [Leptolyngbya sp. NIES-2104]GAP95157.1 hypothetical protein NIES2104_16770 [Leptolyngbya sp. NIES-2104]
MSLQGLPDFHNPIQFEQGWIFYPYENAGNCFVLPNAIDIGNTNDKPDFNLILVRGQNPILPPKPHGLLEFRLRTNYPLTEALDAIRTKQSDATIQPVIFRAGFLRLYADEIPNDLKAPIPLAWNGLTSARYGLTVSDLTAIELKGALTNNVLKLMARAEMEMIGVAPRLPIQVRFDPAVLIDRLATLGDAQRQIACEEITTFFRSNLLPLEIIGDSSNLEFAETMTDWVRAQFGTLIPSPNNDGRAYIKLASVSSGHYEWDLSQPLQAYRTVILTLDPLASARRLVQEKGLSEVFQEAIVSPIPTGSWSIAVSANLPDRRPGVLSISVCLKAAPVLPFRPQARVISSELLPPNDSANLLLRLSPNEPLNYTFSTTVVIQDINGVQQLNSEDFSHTGDRLYIRPNQFPVNFLMLDAARSIIAIAKVQGICRWQEGEKSNAQWFDLDGELTLALPKTATNSTIELTAQSLDSSQTLKIAPFPAKNCQIGLHSFREYGAHQISIECEFSEGLKIYAIELLPEDSPDINVLFFTPVQPVKVWSWFAKSPFKAGYRYRPRRDPAVEWSAVQSPFVPLKIQGDLT